MYLPTRRTKSKKERQKELAELALTDFDHQEGQFWCKKPGDDEFEDASESEGEGSPRKRFLSENFGLKKK